MEVEQLCGDGRAWKKASVVDNRLDTEPVWKEKILSR